MTGNGNNTPGYDNKNYDAKIREAINAKSFEEHFKALHEAESILINDAPIIPLTFRDIHIQIKDKVKGVLVLPTSLVDLKNAYIE